MLELHQKHPVLGLDSLYHLLKPKFGCSRKRVYCQMRLAGITSVRCWTYKATTNSSIAPHCVQSPYTKLFERPNQAWVGDITYISPGEDRCYPALVKDLCARKIVGYTFSGRIDTVLTLEAMDMAIRRGKPSKGLIFHGDGGVQYAIMTFRKWLESYGIR